MKKILHVLFLITLVSTFAVKTEEYFADTQEQQKAEIDALNQKVRESQPIPKTEKTNLEVRATPKRGFFDRISDWSNKRTLSKKFTEHAKNSNDGTFNFSDETTKKMWGSLGKQDQIDLVKEWSDTRIKTIDKELNNNRKKYENAVKSYEAGNKKIILAEVDRIQKEIQENDKRIARAKAKLDSTTSTETKNTLTEQISRLKELQNAQKNNEKEALESITKKMKDLKNRYNTDKDDILAKRDTNMNAFTDSINSTYEEESLIEAKVIRKSEKTTQPTAKPTTVTVEPRTRQPEVPDEPNDAALTEAEIKNLTDQELAQKLDEIAAKYPGSHNNDPEYQKLEAEEKLRTEINKQAKSTGSILDDLGWKPTTIASDFNTSRPSSTDSSENLGLLKYKSRNWSYDEIEEAIRSGEYSSKATAFLISELPENRRQTLNISTFKEKGSR